MPVSINAPSVPGNFVVFHPEAAVVGLAPYNRFALVVSPRPGYVQVRVGGPKGGWVSGSITDLNTVDTRQAAAAIAAGMAVRVGHDQTLRQHSRYATAEGDLVVTPAPNALEIHIEMAGRTPAQLARAQRVVLDPASAADLARILANAADVADGTRPNDQPL